MRTIIIIVIMLFLIGCTAEVQDKDLQEDRKEQMRPYEIGIPVDLVAEDGVKLKATFYNRGSIKGIVLLHMLNRNRQDWDVGEKYQDYDMIAVDFRGHGESEGDWKELSDFNSMVLDAEAAGDYLKSQGVEELYVIGGSIGANIALQYGIREEMVRKVVMLSPGLDYRGVSAENIAELKRPAYIIASSEDSYSADSSKELYKKATDPKKLEIYSDIGHGTTMLGKRPELMQEIIGWIG